MDDNQQARRHGRLVFIVSGAMDMLIGGVLVLMGLELLPVGLNNYGVLDWSVLVLGAIVAFISVGMVFFNLPRLGDEDRPPQNPLSSSARKFTMGKTIPWSRLTVIAIVLAACSPLPGTVAGQDLATAEIQIYSQLARPYCSQDQAVFYPSAAPIEPEVKWEELQKSMPALQEETWKSFAANNSPGARSLSLVGILQDCESDYLPCEYDDCSLDDFPVPWGYSIIGFSRVGINGSGTQLLIEMFDGCFECGWGKLILFELQGGKWKEIEEFRLFVS